MNPWNHTIKLCPHFDLLWSWRIRSLKANLTIAGVHDRDQVLFRRCSTGNQSTKPIRCNFVMYIKHSTLFWMTLTIKAEDHWKIYDKHRVHRLYSFRITYSELTWALLDVLFFSYAALHRLHRDLAVAWSSEYRQNKGAKPNNRDLRELA